jgi:hypothetical protein
MRSSISSIVGFQGIPFGSAFGRTRLGLDGSERWFVLAARVVKNSLVSGLHNFKRPAEFTELVDIAATDLLRVIGTSFSFGTAVFLLLSHLDAILLRRMKS